MAEILQGGTGRHRNMAAFFLRAVQGGVVARIKCKSMPLPFDGLNCLSVRKICSYPYLFFKTQWYYTVIANLK